MFFINLCILLILSTTRIKNNLTKIDENVLLKFKYILGPKYRQLAESCVILTLFLSPNAMLQLVFGLEIVYLSDVDGVNYRCETIIDSLSHAILLPDPR